MLLMGADVDRNRIATIVIASSLLTVLLAGCPAGPEAPVPDPGPADRGEIQTSATASGSVAVNETATLTASATSEAGSVTFAWLQTGGSGVVINDASAAIASFVAPSVVEEQTLTFLVTTTDAAGNAGRAEAQVVVQADPNFGAGGGSSGGGSARPKAAAGLDQFVSGDSTVTLDGSGSTGRSLRFTWRQLGGATVELTNATEEQATFVAPAHVAGADNRFEFELQIADGQNRTSTDRTIVTVLAPGESNPDGATRVLISTTLGDIKVELDAEKAPVTVTNFLQYTDDRYYDGTIFHRVIAGFVVQGGGFLPGLTPKTPRDPIVNESDNGLKNVRGSIAMARTTEPNSATSQFYINVVTNSSLDATDNKAGYAVFGKVIEGLDIVDRIASVQTGARNGFQDVPLTDVVITSIRRVTE